MPNLKDIKIYHNILLWPGIMLISVHIPKTGGASFKTLLQSHFGDKMLEVYNDRPMNKNTIFRNISAILSMINSIGLSKKYDCIHGHFLPIKYRHIKKKSYVIWLREPAERLVSRYYHWKRNYLRHNKSKNRFVKNIDISVKEFCSIKHYQNIYSKYLWGMKIEMFDFIGITENYENSLKIFRSKFEISQSASIIMKNINPQKLTAKYSINDELRSVIYQNNIQDYKIYYTALKINKRMQEELFSEK